MEVHEIDIDSVSGFVKHLEQRRGQRMIFRGQSELEWDLVPSVFRSLKKKLIRDDREAATGQEVHRVRASEELMLDEFKQQAIPHLKTIPVDNNNWEWLALARHHKLPTRLLDWTEHAGTALFFAVAKEDNGENDSAVWFATLNEDNVLIPRKPRHNSHLSDVRKNDDPFKIDEVHLYRPPHIAARIIVQRSCFTVHPTNYLVESHRWPGIDLHKLIIPNNKRIEIRESLRALGVHRAALFPELDGIATDIKHRYGFS
jgi:hypothetical protein